jgi:PAS domain S-box-containing protein
MLYFGRRGTLCTKTLLASLRPLAAAVDQAITIVDVSGHVLEWNPTAERLYGITRTEIIGKEITSFFSAASLIVQRVLDTGKAVDSTYHQPRPGIHVLATATPIFVEGQLAGALAAERDVTRVVELSTDLVAARDRVAVLEKQLTLKPAAEPTDGDPFSPIKGQHHAILRAVEMARRIAPTEAISIIRGESGVGKELFAHGIHKASKRAGGPFVALNCGAIPASLFESELFGYAPGAFTGASPKGQPGKLELAKGGTLFLDEVGELPPELQVKLLRFLDDHQFYRIGGSTSIVVDVRIVVATNRNLEEMVQQRQFRDDLYWRLNVVSLDLPPLRERKADIVELTQMYIHLFSQRHGRSISQVDPPVIQALMEHNWPGNVRELRNTVERLVVLADGGVIGLDLLPAAFRPALKAEKAASPTTADNLEGSPGSGLQTVVTRIERDEILAALAAHGGNRSAAAKRLGIARGTLYYKCKQLNITL